MLTSVRGSDAKEIYVAGIGGTIFHALRYHYVFLYMDVVPILLLVVMGAVYLWIRIHPKLWQIGLVVATFVRAAV